MAIEVYEPTIARHSEWAARLDACVHRAREAAYALRKLDQEAVDRSSGR